MGRNKIYDGYQPYQYLTPGFDYKSFELREAERPDWSYTIPLSKVENERFERFIEDNVVISVHEHPCRYPVDLSKSPDLFPEGRQFMAYKALSRSGLDCVFDNLMDGRAIIHSKHGWDWLSTIHDLGMRLCDIAHQEFVIHCRDVEDIERAYYEGRLAWVACLESATCIENEVDRIDVLYGLGLRSLGICYSESNMLGGGMGELNPDSGLTDFGFDCVKRMNKLGMLIDVGHANDRTSIEVIEASGKPIYDSHSGPAAIARGHVKCDEVLQALAENNGILGLGGAGRGFRTDRHPVGSIESYMECMEYCIELMGIDHVSYGPDTLYGDHQDHYAAFQKKWTEGGYGHYDRHPEHAEVEHPDDPGYVKGLENPNELVNVIRWMIKHGYSDEEISKVMGLNVIDLLKQVW
ncbi:MAG: dipeptidase [Candidatus Bathyarchaeia archaeon]